MYTPTPIYVLPICSLLCATLAPMSAGCARTASATRPAASVQASQAPSPQRILDEVADQQDAERASVRVHEADPVVSDALMALRRTDLASTPLSPVDRGHLGIVAWHLIAHPELDLVIQPVEPAHATPYVAEARADARRARAEHLHAALLTMEVPADRVVIAAAADPLEVSAEDRMVFSHDEQLRLYVDIGAASVVEDAWTVDGIASP